jgi:CheY-like chemotaxis protein
MNRNLITKRKCNTSPGTVSVPVAPRARECSEAALPNQDAETETPSERVAIKTRVVVSISGDLEFDLRLRMLAMQTGQIVIRVESVDDALRIVDAGCAGIILLDLDSMGRTALEMAGDILRDPLCPPVILLTGKGEQLDLRMTVFAGSVLEKSTDTYRILRLLKTILEGWSSSSEQPPSQRGLIRWEDSGNGPVPRVPAQRYWGINE